MYHVFLAVPTLAVADPMVTRLIVCAVCVVVGAILIVSGLNSIKSKKAAGTLKQNVARNLVGMEDKVYEGKSAVLIGKIRVACGIGVIIFGIIFIFVGPFLAKQ